MPARGSKSLWPTTASNISVAEALKTGDAFRTGDMRPVRILIVDDSAVFRKVLSDLLASDPEIVVAGVAGNGRQALARIAEIKPDVVTLDIDMPGMNGMEALVEIRKLYAKLPVIMFSALTERGATATVDALARGASDYVAKPSYRETPERSQERVRKELLQKIKVLCAEHAPRPLPGLASTLVSVRPERRIDVIAIGTSTGGPGALGTDSAIFRGSFCADRDRAAHAAPVYASAG